jgi:hypothetical protein
MGCVNRQGPQAHTLSNTAAAGTRFEGRPLKFKVLKKTAARQRRKAGRPFLLHFSYGMRLRDHAAEFTGYFALVLLNV